MGWFDWMGPKAETVDNVAVQDIANTAGNSLVDATDQQNAKQEDANYWKQDAAATAALPPLPDDPQSQALRQQMDDNQKWNQFYADQAHANDPPANVSPEAVNAYEYYRD